jgi:hypothetical protein
MPAEQGKETLVSTLGALECRQGLAPHPVTVESHAGTPLLPRNPSVFGGAAGVFDAHRGRNGEQTSAGMVHPLARGD